MNSIQDLIGLQKIDTHLEEIEELLGNLPRKVAALKSEEKTLTSDFEQGKERLKEIKVELHKAEVNVTEYKEKIEKLKDQLFLVTNNKQYDALMHEIDSLKEKLDQNETKELELLEEKDKFVNNIENEGTQLKSLADKLITRKKKLEIALSESAGEKSALEQKRQDKVKQIDPHNIALYNQVSAARDGLAVVHLSGSSCSGCGAAITMQTVSEIRSRNAIYRCDVCSRFVYSNHNSIN